jgi:hypothetical protein
LYEISAHYSWEKAGEGCPEIFHEHLNYRVMNKKSLIYATVIGITLGILVLHPLWVSLHVFDGQHSENSSAMEFMTVAYKQAFTFDDLGHTLISVFAGVILAVLVLTMRDRKKRSRLNKNS